MTGWEVFQAEAPELAAFVRERLDLRVSYLATLRSDGAPRVNPVTPWFAEGRLFIRMYPGSVKVRAIRDPLLVACDRSGRHRQRCHGLRLAASAM